MLITNSRRARQVAAWAALGCAAVLVAACGSSGSSAGSSTSITPTTAVAASASPAAPSTPSASSSAPASSPGTASASPSTAVSQTAANTFIAEGQDVRTALFEPACGNFGCALSGDSTAFLYQMKWSTWTTADAVGTGTYKLDACNPSCAAGPVYPVAAVATFSQPVKVCSSSGTRWFWSRVSFSFPDGLPKALQGQNAPQNPWTFANVIVAAQQSCG